MRRFLTTSFIILALVVSAAGATPVAHAQFYDAMGNSYSTQAEANAADNASNAAQSAAITDTGSTVTSAQYGTNYTAQNGATAAEQIAAAATDAKIGTDPKLAGDTGAQFGAIMTWIMTLFAWLVGVAALTLDYAVYYTVITMGNYVHNLSAIGVTWRILRDIANIMFIFGFLGAGIATILNVDQYGWKTKMLPMLLVGAIFLNFSLFITEAMIDGTNLFATQFMTQINGGQPMTAASLSGITVGTFGSGKLGNEGISNKIMSQLGLQSIYGEAARNTGVFASGHTWIIGFMGILLFLITAFVMFSLAFILIARFVALIFFIILCPVGFMGLALPGMQYRAGQWWKNFLEQIITAPILLLLLYVALAVITDAQFLTGFKVANQGTNWLGTVTNNVTAFVPALLSFLVAMGLLLVVVIKAKSMSAFGADKATTLAGKLTFGATAWGMRNTVGRVSSGAAHVVRTSKYAQRFGKTSRLLTSALDQGAKASFDIRGATIGGGLKGLKVEAGEAQKGGYKAARDASVKGHEEYVKSVHEAIDAKGATPEEEAKIKMIEARKEHLDEVRKRAEEVQKKVEEQSKEQIAQHEAEVKRLQEMQKEHIKNHGLPDADIDQKLTAAQKQLDAVSKPLIDANKALQKARKDHADAIEEETKAIKESTDRIGADKKKASIEYAGSISGYGPSANVAAKKILKDARTSADKKLLETLNKAIKTADKDSGGGGKPSTSAPTASAPTTPAP